MLRSLYHLFLAFFGNRWYRRPSEKLFVVGVTGTKGKSTVVELINAILEASGRKTALLSSVRRKVGAKSDLNVSDNTMPGRLTIQNFLADAVKAHCEYAILEVTSQGVVQHRHKFIDWDTAIFLNLAPEHIEAHGSFEKYREAKVAFFRELAYSEKPQKTFLINEDDPNRQYFEEAARHVLGSKIIFFSRDRFVKQEIGSRYDLASRASRELIGDWLLADFNLENAAAAVAFAKSQKIDWATIKRALDNFHGVPGRLEFVQKSPYAVVIDYAHTPDSLEKVYKILRPESISPRSAGEMICVLGAAGGGRDKWKRPEMGRVAATYCDKIILTSEDPYDENPAEILRQIEDGFLKAAHPRLTPQNHHHIPDRKAAVKKALMLAEKGDVVVLTGKGSEAWMHLKGGRKIPWNERKMVEEAIEEAR